MAFWRRASKAKVAVDAAGAAELEDWKRESVRRMLHPEEFKDEGGGGSEAGQTASANSAAVVSAIRPSRGPVCH